MFNYKDWRNINASDYIKTEASVLRQMERCGGDIEKLIHTDFFDTFEKIYFLVNVKKVMKDYSILFDIYLPLIS